MSDNPQVRIEVAEAGEPERCANCNYFAQARGSTLQLFNMGWCTMHHVEVLPEAVCRRFEAAK